MKKIHKIQDKLIEAILADRFMIEPTEYHLAALSIRSGNVLVPMLDGTTIDMIGLATAAKRHGLDSQTIELAKKYLEKAGG